MAIAAIIPFIPLITKLVDYVPSKDKKVTEQAVDIIKNSSGKTEIAQGGYIYTLYSIYHSIIGCGEELTPASFSCVSLDQWVMLAGFISMAYATLRGKIKDSK